MNMQRAAKRSRLRKGDGSPIRYMGSGWDSSILEDTDSGNDEGPEEVYLSNISIHRSSLAGDSTGEGMESPVEDICVRPPGKE